MMKNMLWTALLGAVLSIGQVKAQPAAIQKIIETAHSVVLSPPFHGSKKLVHIL